jgi:hypothetical protein
MIKSSLLSWCTRNDKFFIVSSWGWKCCWTVASQPTRQQQSLLLPDIVLFAVSVILALANQTKFDRHPELLHHTETASVIGRNIALQGQRPSVRQGRFLCRINVVQKVTDSQRPRDVQSFSIAWEIA